MLDGKTCLVTGANRGIGKEVAAALLRAGGRVILVCRDADRAGRAAQELRARTGHAPRVVLADLAAPASLRAAARELSSTVDRLDVLVHNAATIPRLRQTTPDGIEMQLAVNHLAPFLLTQLLLPQLRAAPAARVITVSSNAHRRGRLDFDDLQAERNYARQQRYRATKLANVLFTRELARRLAGSTVTAYAVRPGTIHTGLVADFLGPLAFLRWLLVASRPARGAAPIARLAMDPALTAPTGQYFDRFRPRQPSRRARDVVLQERLWAESERLTGATWGARNSS